MRIIDRYRARREAARRAHAIEKALREANSPAVREEIRAIAQRFYY